MKILFVFPNISDAGYKLVGVSTLSALAKKAGHETALFDTSFMDTSSISKVKHFKSNNAIGEQISPQFIIQIFLGKNMQGFFGLSFFTAKCLKNIGVI